MSSYFAKAKSTLYKVSQEKPHVWRTEGREGDKRKERPVVVAHLPHPSVVRLRLTQSFSMKSFRPYKHPTDLRATKIQRMSKGVQ